MNKLLAALIVAAFATTGAFAATDTKPAAATAKPAEAAASGAKKAEAKPAAAKPAYLEKYKKQMQDLIAAFDEVKKGIEAGNDAAVKAAFDKLSDLKKKGHEDFGADD